MPYELYMSAPSTVELREYQEPPLGDRQIRIRTEFASPKHGSELVAYRNDEAARRRYDAEWGCMIPLPADRLSDALRRTIGNMAVGVVTEVGPEVTRYRPGDRVFGHLGVRETHTVDETRVDPLPRELTPEAAVCLDPAVMALAVRDAPIRLGDRVAVFGLGAIGLMAVQLARIAGAHLVIAVDPVARRRALAVALGADVALDPRADDGDVGLAIRRLTEPVGPLPDAAPERRRVLGGYWEVPSQWQQRGVDVAVEVSGNPRALHQAIRATRFGGTVCVLSFYGGEAVGLRLGDEFHINRIQLVSARAESLPMRDAPGWTLQRLVELALSWLKTGRLSANGIVTPIVAFAESAQAFRRIAEHPEEGIKLGVRFS